MGIVKDLVFYIPSVFLFVSVDLRYMMSADVMSCLFLLYSFFMLGYPSGRILECKPDLMSNVRTHTQSSASENE